MHADGEDHALGVHHQMAFAPLNGRAAIIAAFRTTHPRRFNRLAIDMAALGVGSRPLSRRTRSRSAVWIASQIPVLRHKRK